MTTYFPSHATIDGWLMRRVALDHAGRDRFGWKWGDPEKPLYHLADGIDSLTVRAPCPVIALAEVLRCAGWPPRQVRRLNWEYA